MEGWNALVVQSALPLCVNWRRLAIGYVKEPITGLRVLRPPHFISDRSQSGKMRF